MILPKEIRQKSAELFSTDKEKQRTFLMGAAFALGYDLKDFDIIEDQQQKITYPCQEALEEWLAYKKEKRQSYKPRGLEALKKKLLQMSMVVLNMQRLLSNTRWQTIIQDFSLLKIIQ